jgi:hypothetical protein
MPIAEMVLQDRRDRHDRELTERAARRRDAERDGLPPGGRLPRDRPENGPETGRRQAEAREHVSDRQHHAFGCERDHQHAADIEHAPARNRTRGAEPVGHITHERREGTHQQHGERGTERP